MQIDINLYKYKYFKNLESIKILNNHLSGSSDLKVWCYDENLTLKWLETKTKRVSEALQENNVELEASAQNRAVDLEQEKSKLIYI